MEISIKDIGIEEAARLLEDLALMTRSSMERDDMPGKVYIGVLELIESLSAAIQKETEATA